MTNESFSAKNLHAHGAGLPPKPHGSLEAGATVDRHTKQGFTKLLLRRGDTEGVGRGSVLIVTNSKGQKSKRAETATHTSAISKSPVGGSSHTKSQQAELQEELHLLEGRDRFESSPDTKQLASEETFCSLNKDGNASDIREIQNKCQELLQALPRRQMPPLPTRDRVQQSFRIHKVLHQASEGHTPEALRLRRPPDASSEERVDELSSPDEKNFIGKTSVHSWIGEHLLKLSEEEAKTPGEGTKRTLEDADYFFKGEVTLREERTLNNKGSATSTFVTPRSRRSRANVLEEDEEEEEEDGGEVLPDDSMSAGGGEIARREQMMRATTRTKREEGKTGSRAKRQKNT